MFTLAIILGIYTYALFFLGIIGMLYGYVVILFTICFAGLIFVWKRKEITTKIRILKKSKITDKFSLLLLGLFVLQVLVNLIGALGPELAFDALWYHLTLPKLYLLSHSIYHIPGGLLYYSDMPKLAEMLYVSGLAFGNEITVKIIHFAFGLLTALALYKVSRKFSPPLISLIAVIVFYSNLVVDWESITAYIDLVRAFFEIMALWSFSNWWETDKKKWLVYSALMVGLAITTKVLAIGSLVIFLLLVFYKSFKKEDKKFRFAMTNITTYLLVAVCVPLPWFIFSYIATSNPIYPFFTHTYEITANAANPMDVFVDIWNLFTKSADPLSPLYLIFFPLLFVTFSKLRREIKLIVWYCGLSLVLWYFTPRTGGGRFILPYLPAMSLLCAAIYSQMLKNTKIYIYLSRLLLGVTIFVALISIGYRGIANSKYLPVIIGMQSKQTFLTNHLNFPFGDFYDTDTHFAQHITENDRVLLIGFHNLYYIDFPFVHITWVKKRARFTYIAIQNTVLPKRFKNWQLVYTNDKTLVQLYKPPKGECPKQCQY